MTLRTTFVAMLVALALLIQGMPTWQPPAIAAEKPKSSPTAPKAGPMEMPAPPAVTEVPKDFPIDIVKGDDIEGLPEPPTEPLKHPPLPIPEVDPTNPESVALDKAQRTGNKVEILSARTETQTTFANPQGTLTTELSAGPIRVRRGDGFVPIDTTLEVLDGAVIPKAAQGEIKLSNGGAAGSQLAAVGSAGKRLSFNWPQALPTPVLKGNTATYADVAPGQDLVVKATPSGFETFVVLKTRPEQPVVITIPLGLDGLSLEKDDVSGELKFSDPKGELEISSSTPMMWSAARDPKVNEPTQIRKVEIQVETTAGASQLVLRPDPGFLSDPATQFPVTIDPAATLTSTLDTFVSSVAPTATFASDPELKVGRFIGGGTNTIFRSFIRFNTSAIAYRTVYSAALYLYQTDAYSCGTSSMWVDKPGTFTSSTSWSNQPTVDGQHWYSGSWSGGAASCPWASGWRSMDGRNLASNWAAAATTYGNLALLAPDENNQDHFRKFNSSDSAFPPKIAVEHDAQSQYPAPGSATAVAGNGQGTISWPAAAFQPELYGVVLYKATPSGWVYDRYQHLPGTQLSTTFTGLTNGTGYIAQVSCFGNGVWGREVSSNIFMPAVPPTAPTNVSAEAINSGANLSWSPSTNEGEATIANYVVYAYNSQGQPLNHMVVNHPSTSGTFSSLTTNNSQGLTNGQPYYFRVTAINTSAQLSPASAPSNTVTPEDPGPASSDTVGLEDFYPYQDFDLGQGTAFANMANGNLVVQDLDHDVPGQGLNMTLSRTYNANRDTIAGPFGRGWVLGASDAEGDGGLIAALGTLDLNRILKVILGGEAMDFIDADGTKHRFLKVAGVWQSPPGVNLKMTDFLGIYTLTRPDGVAYKISQVSSSLRLTQIADRKGNFLNFAYTGDKLTSITDTVGRTLTITQPADLITSVSFNAGGESLRTDFGYSGDRLTSVTHAAGTASAITTEYTYSGDGLRTVKDARGNSTTFDIPAAKLAKITDRSGKEWNFSYTGGTCVPNAPATVAVCLTDPESKTSVWSTNAQGNLRFRRDAGDKNAAGADRFNTESFDWAANRLTSNTDQAGNTTTYSYNPLGQISGSVSNGSSDPTFTSIFAFNYPAPGVGEMTRATTASGTAEQRIWDFAYDSVKGTLLTSEDPLDKLTRMTYYARGMLKSVEDANGKVTTYGDTALGDGGYHASGQPGRITDPLGKFTSFGYDFLGFPETRVDRKSQTWTTDHDLRGNLLSSVTPVGDTTSFCYDANDNPTLVMPPRTASRSCSLDGTDGHSIKTTYDSRDLVSSTLTSSEGAIRKSTYAYYDDAQLKEILEPRSFDPDSGALLATVQKASYLRYPNNRISAFTDEEGDQTDVVYTAHGLPQVVTDPAGDAGRHTVSYSYNRLGQVKSALESGHTKAMRYDYNLHGDTTRQTTPRDTFTLFSPDKMGRPLTITDPNSKVTTREYDNVGNLRLLRQPTGAGAFTTTNYFYTARNEIDYESDPADAAHFIDYVYDDEGNQSFRHDRRDNGATGTIERTTEQVFRADGRVIESKATGAGLSEHRSVFGYDPDGNATSVNTYKDGSATPNVSEITAGYTGSGELKDWSEKIYPPTGAPVTKTGSHVWGQDGLQASNTADGQTSSSTWFLDGNEKSFTPYGGLGSFTSTYYGNGALNEITHSDGWR